MAQNNETPRFHRKVEVPETPDGMMLIKFHGKPEFVPVQNGEPLVGKSRFTQRQIEALIELEAKRVRKMVEELNTDSIKYIRPLPAPREVFSPEPTGSERLRRLPNLRILYSVNYPKNGV